MTSVTVGSASNGSGGPRAGDPGGGWSSSAAGPVDHDLGDGGIGEQRLERSEAGDLVGELFEQRVEARRPEEWLLLTEEIAQRSPQGVVVGRRVVDALRDEPRVDALLEQAVLFRHQRDDAHAASP